MPIKPENKDRYPKNWKEISRRIREERADGKCENCCAINHSHVNRHTREICMPDEDDAIMIVLTVAHLDHMPENCEDDNLKAWCQRFHNRYDQIHRKQTFRQSRLKGQTILNL